MIDTKLITILQTLSKVEWNALDKYIHSPIHNQHDEVKRLFQYLKGLKQFGSENVNEVIVFKAVFKGENFDKVKLRYVRSYLFKLVEDFLAYQEWTSFEQQIALIRAYQKKNINKLTTSKLSQISKNEEKQPFRNASYFDRKHQLELLNYTWNEKQRRRGDMNLQGLSNTLEVAFIIEKLKYSSTMLTHQAVYKTEYETGLLDTLLDYLPNSGLLEIPAIAIYYYSYLALKKPKEELYFQKLKQLIQTHAMLFPQHELKNILLLAINVCIRQINTGNSFFQSELLDLYKTGLESKAFIESGTLSRWTYKNIVEIGLGLKEYDWIETFIHQYEPFIEKAYRKDIFNYNLAKLHYHRKEYDEAMQRLLDLNEKDLLLQLDVKRLQCKIYYELEEWKALDSHAHSFELYVRRQKSIGYHKQNYLNFTRCLKKLLKLNFYDEKEVEKLRLTIQEFKVLPEKRWLLEQLTNQ